MARETRCFYSLSKNASIFTEGKLRTLESIGPVCISHWLKPSLKSTTLLLYLANTPRFRRLVSILCFGNLVNLICVLSLVIVCVGFDKFEKGKGSLKEQISRVKPILENLRSKKKERVDEFLEIQSQIEHICAEIASNGQSKNYGDSGIGDYDLTVKTLIELKSHLKELQNEKVPLNDCDNLVCWF